MGGNERLAVDVWVAWGDKPTLRGAQTSAGARQRAMADGCHGRRALKGRPSTRGWQRWSLVPAWVEGGRTPRRRRWARIKDTPVGRSEVLGASLRTLVGLPLTEGAADALGAEDTLGALEVEGPNEGAPVGLPEALKKKSERQAEAPDTAAMASSPCVSGSSDGGSPRRRRLQQRQRQCVGASNDGGFPRHRAAATTAGCRTVVETAPTAALPRFGGKGGGGLPHHRRRQRRQRRQRRYRRHTSAVAAADGRPVAGDGSVDSSNDGGLLRRSGVSSNGSVAALWL